MKLAHVTDVASAPGEPGRIYVVEREGRVWAVEGGQPPQRPLVDLSAEIGPTTAVDNERGMQSIAFAPDYATSRRFYVFYSDGVGDSRVAEYRDGTAQGTVLLVRHAFADRHYGGALAFGPDRRLYVSLGDARRSAYARHRRLYGTVVSLDPLRPDALKVVARGLRNPFRMAFDPFTGDLVLGDVGESQYEEIDVLRARRRHVADFGWPELEGPLRYSRARVPHYVRPRLTYRHRSGAAVIAGRVLRDPRLPRLRRRFAYADLCAGWIATADLRARHPRGRRTGLVVPFPTSFGEDASHHVYVGTYGGQIYRLDPVDSPPW